MSDWLIKSKDTLWEAIFDSLWRQWSTLGVAGTVESEDSRIIDPDALLLFSLNMGRYDPRLFDEVLDWLSQHGQLINVQRLQQIQKHYHFHSGPQLSAVAEWLSNASKYKLKWSGLAKKFYQKPAAPLFYDRQGQPLPCPPDTDAEPVFFSHGLKRGAFRLRGYTQGFDPSDPACLLLSLRALFGINARAEILALLASKEQIHPSEAARQTHYYQKTVQLALVEMAQSSAIRVRTSKKEKYYHLKPDVLDELLKPTGQTPRWINWPALFKVIEIIAEELLHLCGQTYDSLLLFSQLNKLMLSVKTLASDTGLHELALDDQLSPENFEVHFREKLAVLCEQL